MMNFKYSLVVFWLCFSCQALSVNIDEYQRILKRYTEHHEAGASVIVSKGNKTLYAGAHGLANLEHNALLSPSSVFPIASLTKQFTAAAIMMLVESDKLSLDHKAALYIDGFDEIVKDATIAQLLSHTAGLGDYINDTNIIGNEIRTHIAFDDLIERIKQVPNAHRAGERARYSNNGYVLLAKIIENVSGLSYAEFIKTRIFKPLNMMSSYVGDGQLMARRASGYSRHNGRSIAAQAIDFSWGVGTGNIFSTTLDLSKWYRALADGTLISTQSYQQMATPFKLSSGEVARFGYGLMNGSLANEKMTIHGGIIPGFRNSQAYFPDHELFVSVLCNFDSCRPQDILRHLAAVSMNLPIPSFKKGKTDVNKISSLLGHYKINDTATRTLFEKDGNYFTKRENGQAMQVIPMSNNRFFYPNSLSYFVINTQHDGPTQMTMYHNLSLDGQTAVKINE